MKEIQLANGRGVALVDDEDYEWLNQYRWRLHVSGGYAMRNRLASEKPGTYVILMHQQIAGKKGADHINRIPLDNRRANLRDATPTEQRYNSSTPSSNTSGFKGVNWHKATQKWRAEAGRTHLGLFDSPEDAFAAYVKHVTQVLGQPEYVCY